jgi:hypothetical protein
MPVGVLGFLVGQLRIAYWNDDAPVVAHRAA